MDSFVSWLAGTPVSLALQSQSYWLWPLCETLHFIGLTLLLGVAGFFDLRLLGFVKHLSLRAVKDLMPVAKVGFAINLVTGVLFLISEPAQYVSNASWWAKVGFLGLAGVNVLVFEKKFNSRILSLEPEQPVPMAGKVVAVVSLIAWLGVLYFGRMLPFLDASLASGL